TARQRCLAKQDPHFLLGGVCGADTYKHTCHGVLHVGWATIQAVVWAGWLVYRERFCSVEKPENRAIEAAMSE
ncbi:hypothetical protein, partial [Pseudomonas syringae]|uniref:hypothetical protein n=3 Tax=Pseudomonas syringae TaxID=317 RepID=UPI001E5191BE